ncbi:MAG: tRNA 2-thiouridine(34) synthase MnmA, partial [Planctomycetota bacterium]
MVIKRTRVLVAISGGVDSSTSARLLLEAGYGCAGVFMITNDRFEGARADAEEVARRLGIELHVL